MPKRRTIRYDHELTPAALQLVADFEAREAGKAAKAHRLQVLKEAGRRVAERKKDHSET